MSNLFLLSQESVYALGWTLLHSLWQGLAIAAVFALIKVFTKNANLRYLTACAALFIMVALSVATFTSHYSATHTPGIHSHLQNTTSFSDEIIPTVLPLPEIRKVSSTSFHAPMNWTDYIAHLQNYMPEIVLCWMVGVLLLSLRLLGGCWVAYRFKRTGTRPLPKDWQLRIKALTKQLNIRQKVDVVVSSISPVPMVVGIVRPVVLVPVASLLGLTRDQLETILIHELAHIRRYDNLVNLLQRVVETVFFFHPAVWWVSHSLRTEREHCCDDIATADSNPRLYAGALAALDKLNTPILASAASDGPLLSRIKRLLAVDSTPRRNEFSNFGVVASIVAILVFATVAVQETQADKTNAPSQASEHLNVLVDVSPAMPHAGTTLASSMSPLMATVGRPEWSMARLQGVMGHAFQFEMKEGGKHVMHDNLDWGIAFNYLKELAKFKTFNISKKKADTIDLPALKREARDAVLTSLNRGVPALVWQPMSVEMKKNRHAGYCWGLIVGYNETEETYTVRHPFVKDTYTVRYDAIGHADPAEWFHIRVCEEPKTVDEKKRHLIALQNAVTFANGTRYTDKNFVRKNGKQSNPYGFAAYELWREAFKSADIRINHSHHHADMLQARRLAAAEYVRELATIFPEASKPLKAAAAHYDRELEYLNPLHDLFHDADHDETLLEEDRIEASRLISEALEADREAIAQIQAAIAILDKS